ncbi:hypothetical protein [Nonomuraea fuscirosea]|uniref:hypothetical protein n=1 Tax=Nonomuraea fuscirosea TaxID=1291556 RepID=UPI0033F9F857
MAGIIGTEHLLNYVVATIVGMSLTVFAVFLPVLKAVFRSVPWGTLWLLLTLIDLASSALGGIWYGVIGHPFTDPILFDQIYFEPSNWLETVIYLGFVSLIAVACVACGHAIAALSRPASGNESSTLD